MGALADLRAAVAAALDTITEVDAQDWIVHPLPVDALTPPAFVLVWADPWFVRRVTTCSYEVQLLVRCVSARIDPDPGIEVLELMVERAVAALDRAGLAVRAVGPPGPLEVGGLHYQAAALTVPGTITIGAT